MNRAGRQGRFVLASDRPVLIQHSPPRALRAPGRRSRGRARRSLRESPAESAAGLVASARRSRALPSRPRREAAGSRAQDRDRLGQGWGRKGGPCLVLLGLQELMFSVSFL